MSTCGWCDGPIPSSARRDSRFCGKVCRQTAFRVRRRRAAADEAGAPLVFAYADPPYPGRAWRYYRHSEVDHAALIAELEARKLGGWALSTSEDALRHVLPLCPEGARVCPWVKPHAANPRTYGPHNCWEPLIVVGGRQLQPGVRDWLKALPARGGGTLIGRKPLAFCAWLFQLLGMLPGDELVDVFPGTGVVSRAWRELSLTPAGDTSLRSPATHEVSPRAPGDASRGAPGDASRRQQATLWEEP